MYKNKNKSIAFWLLSALYGLALFLLPTQSARAQAICSTALSDGPTWLESKVHVGDTVHFIITLTAPNGVCRLRNGTNWVVTPDGVSHRIFENFGKEDCNLLQITCPSDAGCIASIPSTTISGQLVFSYGPIQAGDDGRGTGFTTPRGTPVSLLGQSGFISVAAVGDAFTFDCASGTVSKGLATGSGNQPLQIVHPCIQVVKLCNYPQGQTCFQAGQDIQFTGYVTNCSPDISLTNVTLVDTRTGTLLGTNGLPLPQPLTLAIGQAVAFHGSYTPTLAEVCAGSATNKITVTGTDTADIPRSVTNSATAVCNICVTPCLAVTKNCTATTNGGTHTISGSVTNCGNITLTNISITDNIYGLITTIPILPPNTSSNYSGDFAAGSCGTNANFVTAAGFTQCGVPISAHATNACIVTCPPKICIIKEVACFLGSNQPSVIPSSSTDDEFCGTFSKFAVGVSGNTDPAFCYRITVTNCGNIPLTNVSVIDNQFGDFTSNFFPSGPGTVFPPGGSVTYIFKATVDHNLTNVVTTTGTSAVDGTQTSAQDNAVVKVLPASVTCDKQYSIDGGPLTDGQTLPDQAPHTIVWYVTVSNPSSQVNLEFVTLHDLSANLGCEVTLPPFNLPAGASTNFAICTNTVACSNGFDGITNTVSVVASSFSVGTNHLAVCSHDIAGTNIIVDSECSATLLCSKPSACRVTGGGRQDSPPNYPNNVRYITHGGQVGAPVGDHICVVTEDFPIGNPCIHGRWTHVRHQQGGNEGNFHARFYDTLECACLDTNLTPVVVTIGQQTYTNLVYGPGTTTDAVCNPDDRASGPLPRPAPSNKIVFTGIGDYAETQGRRTPVSVLFRVDVEDRSEPGGSHPKGGTPPPDRNRTRIWILTQSELAQLHGAGPDPLLLTFRNAISACNGIDVQDGATVPNGTAAFGVRAPDIDDGGALTRGNYQIHPSIKDCDPFNPTGPGLAKP